MRISAAKKRWDDATRWLVRSAAAAAIAAWSAVAAVSPARSDQTAPALLDNMDGAKPVLRLLDGGPPVRILEHSVQRDQGRTGAAERLQLELAPGSSAHVAYDIPPSIILPEVKFAAWAFCNRPGIQIAAMVELPRSIDPESGKPRRLLIRSEKPAPSDAWQLLTLDNLPGALQAHARVARAKYGSNLDERGAYVTQLVLLAPGGTGATEVWVDQVAIYGVVGTAPAARGQNSTDMLEPAGAPRAGAPTSAVSARPVAATAASSLMTPPAAPRVVQWQGEPFELIKRLGFDAILMGRLPTLNELKTARDHGLFIIAPPPSPEVFEEPGIQEAFSPILAWSLGPLAAEPDMALANRWAEVLEQRDPARPTLLRSIGMSRQASRMADITLIGRATVGSTQTWPEYAAWLTQQRRQARTGTPVWVAVDTHADAHYLSQQAVLHGETAVSPASSTLADLSLATTAAFAAAPRGFCFQSNASLAQTDAATRMRALALELTNLRLGMAEPWMVSGKLATAARSSNPDLTSLVLKVERSHLIVPMRWSESLASSQAGSFILPGVPESSDAYVISVAGPQRLTSRRVTGGLEIAFESLADDALILLTEDGYAYSQVEHYLRTHAPRAAQARVELAALRRQQAAAAVSALPVSAIQHTGAGDELARVDRELTAISSTMRNQNYAVAFSRAAQAEQLLDALEQRLLKTLAPDLPVGTCPVPPDWSTLGDCYRINSALVASGESFRDVPGGEFEDLNDLIATGWQRLERPTAGLVAEVRLSNDAPASGSHCLELEARQTAPDAPPPLAPAPPVWVTSPPVPIVAGQLVEITGLIRVLETPIGSADPVLIFDSLGGEGSALRISATPAWQPFRLVRIATPGAECRLTMALGGAGRVQLDGLRYRCVPITP